MDLGVILNRIGSVTISVETCSSLFYISASNLLWKADLLMLPNEAR